MKFEIRIKSDNDALTNEDAPVEIARILRSIATRIVQGENVGKVRDINGNTVGTYNYDREE